METIAHPPATLEGWYALHQILTVERAELRALSPEERTSALDEAHAALDEIAVPAQGWSAVVLLVGSASEVMLVHFRETLDELREVQQRLLRLALWESVRVDYSFLSVTELGLYGLTAELARDAAERGGAVGDAIYERALAERVEKETTSALAKRRLHPTRPAEMPWVCFYPMSKRRAVGQNWYELSLEERSRLMYAHGLTGRRYAGKVQQVIAGAIGFDAWEWGVTLFARDPLEFKRIVTDMRFDEVSARYAEFGEFWVGKVAAPAEWTETLG